MTMDQLAEILTRIEEAVLTGEPDDALDAINLIREENSIANPDI